MHQSAEFWMQACWDDDFDGQKWFQGTDFLHSPLLDELKALETRVTAEFAVNVPSALVVDRSVIAQHPIGPSVFFSVVCI